MVIRVQHTRNAASIFGDWQETLIWSCLQDIMGDIYADDEENPSSAMALLGDFRFFAGEPNPELVTFRPNETIPEFVILVPQNADWARTIERQYGGAAKRITRYALKKEPDSFDIDRLRKLAAHVSPEYSLRMVDEKLYGLCGSEAWCKDLVSQYPDYDTYRNLGLGVVAVHQGKIVSGASSYASYRNGIEIEIDTREDYRRKGLATACGAKLILECLDKGLYPSWDAHTEESLALARKLGYTFDREYTAYELSATGNESP